MIFVLTVNLPPEVEAIPDQTLEEGDLLELQVRASDPDGDRLAFRRSSPEPDGMNVHPTTGRIEWRIGCHDAGEYAATIEVSDGLPNGVINVEFDITVNARLQVDDRPKFSGGTVNDFETTAVIDMASGKVFEVNDVEFKPRTYDSTLRVIGGAGGTPGMLKTD